MMANYLYPCYGSSAVIVLFGRVPVSDLPTSHVVLLFRVKFALHLSVCLVHACIICLLILGAMGLVWQIFINQLEVELPEGLELAGGLALNLEASISSRK